MLLPRQGKFSRPVGRTGNSALGEQSSRASTPEIDRQPKVASILLRNAVSLRVRVWRVRLTQPLFMLAALTRSARVRAVQA